MHKMDKSREKQFTTLDTGFFERPGIIIARDIIGKYLVCSGKNGVVSRMITEVEVYDGPCDKASHAYRGRTARTEIMFGPAGHWYVYLCYGVYHMLNVVTGVEGYPAAVLIRGVEGYDGPGKLTRGLGITKEQYNTKLATTKTGLWIEDRGMVMPKSAIQQTPRIGIPYAEEWRNKPWRFVLKSEYPATPP